MSLQHNQFTLRPLYLEPSEGAAITICYEGETENEEELAQLERALAKLNISTHRMVLNRKSTSKESLAKAEALFRSVDGRGKLVMVCYSGHGKNASGKLLAVSETGVTIELTAILVYARDRLKAHVIFILDCCYAGLALPHQMYCYYNRVVELLAAGERLVWRAFSERVAAALANVVERDGGSCTVKELFDRAIKQDASPAPGLYRSEADKGSIVLRRMQHGPLGTVSPFPEAEVGLRAGNEERSQAKLKLAQQAAEALVELDNRRRRRRRKE